MLADAELWQQRHRAAGQEQPLDAGFIELPDRLLAEYQNDRQTSELGRILAAARNASRRR